MVRKKLAQIKVDIELYINRNSEENIEGFSIAADGKDYRRILTISKPSIEFSERVREKHRLGEWTILKLPFGLQLSYDKSRYARDLTGIPKNWTFDWVIDEFDDSFNTLAAASLRYHLDYAVTDGEAKREYYEKLIKELTEPEQFFKLTKEEIAHQNENFKLWEEGKQDFLICNCEICENVSKRIREADKKAAKQLKEVREKFLEIVPYLWS